MHKETIATGFVKPKTTSMFFDRIWIPNNLEGSWVEEQLGLSNIPEDVLYNKIMEEDVVYRLERSLFLNNMYVPSIDLYGRAYLFSSNRNGLILKIVDEFKNKYGCELVPILFDKTEFEEMISENCEEEPIPYEYYNFVNQYGGNRLLTKKDRKRINKSINHLRKKNFEQRTIDVIEACIDYIPEIIEDELEWKQVLEFRQDKNSVKSLRRFKNWANINLVNKNKNQIDEILYHTLEEYKFSLHKHGIMTAIGGFSTILSSSASILKLFSSEKLEIISTSFLISAGIISFTSSQIAELYQRKQSPIAYIYNIEKML